MHTKIPQTNTQPRKKEEDTFTRKQFMDALKKVSRPVDKPVKAKV